MLTHELQREELMKKRRDVEVECVEETFRTKHGVRVVRVWRVVR
jgi:hypothetical protein